MNRAILLLVLLVIQITSCKVSERQTKKEEIIDILTSSFEDLSIEDRVNIILISETDCIECVEESIRIVNQDKNSYRGMIYGSKLFPYKNKIHSMKKKLTWVSLENHHIFELVLDVYGFTKGPLFFELDKGKLLNVSSVSP